MTSRQNNLTSRLTDRQTINKVTDIYRYATKRTKTKKETNCKNLIYGGESRNR